MKQGMRIAVISDLHYYSPCLGVKGRAYTNRSMSDQKCLGESGAVIRGALSQIEKSGASALVIAGDITNDGEKVSHEEIRAILREFNGKIPVYPITSTHDWCSDKNARRYENDRSFSDVPVLTPSALTAFYEEFGKERESASFKTRMGFYSKVYEIGENEVLIAVNDDGDGANGASGYSPEHLAWLCRQIRNAADRGKRVIATEHHLLVPSVHRLINKSQCIADGDRVAGMLADAGLKLMLVGHSHMQRTTAYTSENGNTLMQINVGAITGYPAPIVYLDTDENGIRVKTDYLQSFDYKNTAYTGAYLRQHTENLFRYILNTAAADKEGFFAFLSDNGIAPGRLSKCYPLIKAAAKKLQTVSVGKAGRLINALTFQKGIDKKALREMKNEPLLPLVIEYFLAVFDGSLTIRDKKDSEKKIVSDVFSLPVKAVRRLPVNAEKKKKAENIAEGIREISEELLAPAFPADKTREIDI